MNKSMKDLKADLLSSVVDRGGTTVIDNINNGITDGHIEAAIECMRHGGVVGFYSRLTYGFATRAPSQEGVDAIYETKNRDRDKPLSIMTSPKKYLDVADPQTHPEIARTIASEHWPGGISMIVEKRFEDGEPIIPAFVTAGRETINLSCMDEATIKLADGADFPLVCTSANVSGEDPVVDPVDCIERFGTDIDQFLLGPPSDVETNTSIIDLTADPPELFREELVPTGDLQAIVPSLQEAKT